jgi:hypothetical protein
MFVCILAALGLSSFLVPCSPLLTTETIEIPSSLLCGLASDEDSVWMPPASPTTAFVRALPWIGKATQIQMEPLTVEDWELLESCPEELEQGGLLRQVSVVYPNQMVQFKIHGSVVRLKVTSVVQDDNDSEYDGWPDASSDETTSTTHPSSPPCVLLVQDTEVIIAPKPRQQMLPPKTLQLRLLPSRGEMNPAIFDLVRQEEEYWHNVSPGCILLSSQDLPTQNHSNQWAWVSATTTLTTTLTANTRLVRLVKSAHVPPSHAGTLVFFIVFVRV